MADPSKATIYVDVDDEITNVIDKVLDSSATVIALVLPKRASVFQSTVNMKLLKRKSEDVNKKVVLVTNEANLLPLAGGVGLFVAKTLNSKPEIPAAPVFNESIIEADEDEPLVIDQNDIPSKDIDLKDSKTKTLAELASGDTVAPSVKTKLDKDLDTIDLDNTGLNNQEPPQEDSVTPQPKKTKKDKKEKIKVPNFKKFKIAVVLIVLILLIGIVGYVALAVLPSATIDINTNSSNVNTNVSFTIDPSASSVNLASNTIPAKEVSTTKTYSATVNATGQQNDGTKASGSVVFNVCEVKPPFTDPSSISAGTGITQNNLTYVTDSTATFSYNTTNSQCVLYSTGNINISAQQAGSSYNTQNNNTSFSVPGYSGVSATGGASGGTDNMVTVVSQNDITNAQNKITTNNNSIKSSLSSRLSQDGYYPIGMTFNSSQPTVTENNQVGSQNSSVTVTESITYTMYGVFKKDLNTLLSNNISSQVGNSESILSTGLNNASFSYTNGNTNPTQITIQSTAIVGPNINVGLIKSQAEGKKIAQIKNIVEGNSNVTSVKVTLSPFYVSSAPNNPSKIHVHIAKPTKTVN